MKIGIIAEDDSDVAVVRAFTLALLTPKRVGFKSFVGNGCGKLKRKCKAWACNLVRQGCPFVVVVHDLDTNDEAQLRADLTSAIAPANARTTIVLIPRREIEAWLLYDAAALAAAFHERRPPRLPGNPESLNDPKKYLTDLIWRKYRKVYLNTLHNELIANRVKISFLKACPSFAPHFGFARHVKEILR